MLMQEVIRCSSPWSSPIVMVKKKGVSWRFCVDFRKLNEVTFKDAFPQPQIDETLEALEGAQMLSTLELASGYWQVRYKRMIRRKQLFLPMMHMVTLSSM